MAIKLPDTTAGLLRPVQEARPERAGTLGQLVALGVNRTEAREAQVQSVAPANNEQRQQLFNRLLDALIPLQGKPDSPQKQEQLARLSEERLLLNSPLLKLVRLQIQNQSLTTYTDRPLKPGDTVQVYLKNNQLWQLAPGNRSSSSGTGESTARLANESSAAQALAARLQAAAGGQGGTLQESLKTQLAQTLRSVMPLKDKPDLALTLPLIEQLSSPQQRQLFSTDLQQALRQAARQLRQPEMVTQPANLQRTLANSGLQLEHKLAQAAQAGRESGEANQHRQSEAVSRALTGDWKAALLKVLTQVKTELNQLGQSPELKPGAPANLGTLLAELANRPAPELNDRALRSQLMQLLHQQTLHSIARVQFQQLSGLSHQLSQGETAQPTQSWSLEIPLRLGQEVQPLFMQIDEQWESSDEEGKKGAGKVRQWQVLLTFELPEAGTFHAQITVRDPQVAARLWAEQPDTADTVRKRLSQLHQRLEEEGLEVTRLECHDGAPPRRKTEIHYSLVDITT